MADLGPSMTIGFDARPVPVASPDQPWNNSRWPGATAYTLSVTVAIADAPAAYQPAPLDPGTGDVTVSLYSVENVAWNEIAALKTMTRVAFVFPSVQFRNWYRVSE